MQIRNGNNQKYEHTFQLGILVLTPASEGPDKQEAWKFLYLQLPLLHHFLATGNDMNLKYQDLSFKLNFPTRKAGTFYLGNRG